MPSEMRLAGTARCFDLATCSLLTQRLQAFGRHVAELHGCEIELAVDWEATPLVNPPGQTELALAAARRVVDPAQVDADFPPTMAAEDFADMLLEKPGAFMFLGNAGEPASTRAPLHTPQFDFNDDVIPYGVAYWVALVEQAGAAD
jgi:hippurate hydrolase